MENLTKYIQDNQQLDVEIKRLEQEAKDVQSKLAERKKTFNTNSSKIASELGKYGASISTKSTSDFKTHIPIETQKAFLTAYKPSRYWGNKAGTYLGVYIRNNSSAKTFTTGNKYAIYKKERGGGYLVLDNGKCVRSMEFLNTFTKEK